MDPRPGANQGGRRASALTGCSRGGKLQVIPVTGALVHHHFPVGSSVPGQLEAKRAMGVRTTQGDGGTAGSHQPDLGIGRRLPGAEPGFENQRIREAAHPLKTAFDGMGADRTAWNQEAGGKHEAGCQ